MKRKTWKDRRCHHGNKPTVRIIYDFIHCDHPKCWDEVLANVGFRRIKKNADERARRLRVRLAREAADAV